MVNCGGVRAAASRARALIILVLLVLGSSLLLRRDFSHPPGPINAFASVSLQAEFGHLPLAFEPNQGQASPSVQFLAHGLAYGLYLTREEAVLALPGDRLGKSEALLVQMRFTGGNQNADVSGLGQLPGRTNYLLGHDPGHWHRNIPQFSRVRYRQLYHGIDLDFYGRQGRLEYDFEVLPGADFRQIQLDFSGAESMKLTPAGDLLVELRGRELRFQAPHIYQEVAGSNREVSGKFVVRDTHVMFEVGTYDRSRTLVIDPVLSFSTFLGGSSGDATCTAITLAPFVPHCPAITVDSAQRVYIAGAAKPPAGFPAAVAGPPAPIGPNAAEHVFVARINSSGTQLDFLTFLGGSGTDFPAGVGVDSGFNLYVAGTTNSADFPITEQAFQVSAPVAGEHVFVSKLDPTGSVNVYSTYLAGSGSDTASGLAVDVEGREYVFGITSSTDFPITPGRLQGTFLGTTNQFFFSKLDPTAGGSNSLLYSTFIGGSTPSTGTVTGGAIAVDSNNPPSVYLAGGTNFTDMPVVNSVPPGTFPTKNAPGSRSVWAAKLNAPATNTQQYTPSFETYFGGSGDDVAYGVATDGTNTYVTGSTSSSGISIPSGETAFQGTFGGGAHDGFVAKFAPPTTTGTTQGSATLAYFTYLGGAGDDTGLAIVADPGSSTNVHVAGFTDSGNFAANTTAFGPGGGSDAFVARIVTNTTTSTVNTSSVTRIGGIGTDIGTSVAEDEALNTYASGDTFSRDFPTIPGSVQATFSGTSDAFVSKLGPSVSGLGFFCNAANPVSGGGCPKPAPANPSVSPSPVGVGNKITFNYCIFNQADPVTGVVFTDNIQGTKTSSAIQTASVGNCSSAGGIATGATGSGSCSVSSDGTSALCNLGTVNTSNTTTSGSTTTTAPAMGVTVTVTATAPSFTGVIPPKPPDVGNVGTLSFNGSTLSQASNSASVNDFGIVPANGATSVTVKAGETASYALNIVPTGPIPEAVSLSATGLPAQATASFAPSASIPNLNNGARSVTLDIATTFRVTTPASLFSRGGFTYALWLPLSGLACMGGGLSRKRRFFMALTTAALLSGTVLQSACSSQSRSTSTTTGTPAGTYNITVNANAGAIRSTVVQLVVQ